MVDAPHSLPAVTQSNSNEGQSSARQSIQSPRRPREHVASDEGSPNSSPSRRAFQLNAEAPEWRPQVPEYQPPPTPEAPTHWYKDHLAFLHLWEAENRDLNDWGFDTLSSEVDKYYGRKPAKAKVVTKPLEGLPSIPEKEECPTPLPSWAPLKSRYFTRYNFLMTPDMPDDAVMSQSQRRAVNTKWNDRHYFFQRTSATVGSVIVRQRSEKSVAKSMGASIRGLVEYQIKNEPRSFSRRTVVPPPSSKEEIVPPSIVVNDTMLDAHAALPQLRYERSLVGAGLLEALDDGE